MLSIKSSLPSQMSLAGGAISKGHQSNLQNLSPMSLAGAAISKGHQSNLCYVIYKLNETLFGQVVESK